MNLKAVIIQPGLWGLGKGNYQKIGRKAIEASGLFWHEHYKPIHFQIEAYARYGYRPRKRRLRKHEVEVQRRPLVWTGESEKLALAQNRVVARATDYAHYHAEVTVSAPKLNFHSNEMTRTTEEENLAMEARFAEVFEQGMEAAARENGVSGKTIELWKGHAA